MDYERRKVLTLGSAAALAALAGCSGSDSSGENGDENGAENDDGNGGENGAESGDGNGGENGSENGGENGSENGDEDEGGEAVPGRDQLGGPDSLQSSAEVDAITLEADQGAGQYVNTPAVVWLEPGGEITWSITNGAHSVTAYHPENEKQQRIPESAEPFDSGTLSGGETFSHTFETEGVYNYYCRPHEGLGMVGLVIVGEPGGGPGTTAPDGVEASTAATNLGELLSIAGVDTSESSGETQQYSWSDATWDSYWYSLYNMSTNIAMSGNGVPFPLNDQMEQLQQNRMPAMLEAADTDRPPINNPNLSFAAFTSGDPHFTQQPVFEDDTGRPNGETLAWDKSKSSGVVSPSSLAWTHLKGITWAKNFQAHFDVLPPGLAAKFRAQLLTTLAQVGINASILVGGSRGNGALTHGDSFEFLSEYRPAAGEIEDKTRRPHHHAAMVWFLSDITSLAQNGWFGYVNPRPLIPVEAGGDGVFDPPVGIQGITDGVATTTMDLFDPAEVIEMESTRSVGLLLAAIGYYGPQAGGEQQRQAAADYANQLAAAIEQSLTSSGRVENGAANQAATQGIVGQGLLWASEMDGVDHTGTAETVLGYLLDDLWDGDAGTFRSGVDDDVYTISARDAGDITGGINAAENVLGMDVKEKYAQYFNQTMNRGRLQRAERPPSRDEAAEHTLPLPPMAGGEHGQAAVYNAEVEYDTGAGEWTVTDDTFDTEAALYLANQEIWISQWSGDFYQGRGLPGQSDTPPQ
ncbi:plastocyanin/azurin family copper-binding protein [Halovenus rubra]|uniref:Plastocyanin/azurin family copper-binding protein n=2 Tax=Halovenus rubra TaxID=869890 RepID=A0ABD5X155_9EURY|nr:plastocyanin/azurin family copper-binding protein [Halovenus rubra]